MSAYCDQPHPGDDAEARRWCEMYHRTHLPKGTNMTHDHDRGEHWADNPADDFAWNAYAAGWEAGAAWDGTGWVDLTGHGQAYVDGFNDGHDIMIATS